MINQKLEKEIIKYLKTSLKLDREKKLSTWAFEEWTENLSKKFENFYDLEDGYGSCIINGKYAILNDYAEEDDFTENYRNVLIVTKNKLFLFEIDSNFKIYRNEIIMPFILKDLYKLGGKRGYYVEENGISFRYEGNLIFSPYGYNNNVYKYSIPQKLKKTIFYENNEMKNFMIFTGYKNAPHWYLNNKTVFPYEVFEILSASVHNLAYNKSRTDYYIKKINESRNLKIYPVLEEEILIHFEYAKKYVYLKIKKNDLEKILFKIDKIKFENKWEEIKLILKNKNLKNIYLKIDLEKLFEEKIFCISIIENVIESQIKEPLLKGTEFLLYNLNNIKQK